MGGSKARAPIMLSRGMGVESGPGDVEQRGRVRLCSCKSLQKQAGASWWRALSVERRFLYWMQKCTGSRWSWSVRVRCFAVGGRVILCGWMMRTAEFE